MQRFNALVSHLTPLPVSTQQRTDNATPLDTNPTNLSQTLQTQFPLIQQLDQTLHSRTGSGAAAIAASPALPATLTPAEWLALPPHTQLGSSGSTVVTQQHIDAFAATTGDPQWIHSHLAPSLGSPFGRPIAHGFLVLSLLSSMVADVLPAVEGLSMTVNYGLEKVRWMRPVFAEEQVVGRVWLESAEQLKGGVVHNVLTVEVRVVGADGKINEKDKPAMVAVWLIRYLTSK